MKQKKGLNRKTFLEQNLILQFYVLWPNFSEIHPQTKIFVRKSLKPWTYQKFFLAIFLNAFTFLKVGFMEIFHITAHQQRCYHWRYGIKTKKFHVSGNEVYLNTTFGFTSQRYGPVYLLYVNGLSIQKYLSYQVLTTQIVFFFLARFGFLAPLGHWRIRNRQAHIAERWSQK